MLRFVHGLGDALSPSPGSTAGRSLSNGYAATHAFLPERNGIRPNTLHVLFDMVTLAILIDLAVLMA